MKKLIIAESAGFCFGVSRSVKMAEELIALGTPCYSYGQLIHNEAVVSSLEERGLKVAEKVEDVPPGAGVIIRSHGASLEDTRALEQRAGLLLDATCPKVKHIHRMAEDAESQGRVPVIIGRRDHPEVLAVASRCGNALVFSNAEEFEEWLLEREENASLPLTVVFQTTHTRSNFEKTKNLQKKLCTNCEVFDTICRATAIRQNEAEKLSKLCDAMIVIGSRHSSNSAHLADICREHNRDVQFIPDVSRLDLKALEEADTIGITAGASTPQRIIKEVKQAMTDEFKIQETTAEIEATQTAPETATEGEMTFDQMLEESIKTIYNGDTVTGIVAAITPTEISVDLGTKHSGYIPVSEFTDDEASINDLIKIGDTVEACVVRVNDVEGTVMLSKKRLDAIKTWSLVEEAAENGTVLEGTVTEENKGGVVVSVKGVRVFVPASQTGLPKDAEMSEILKQKVRLKIKEVNRGRRRVVGSIRDVQREERRERSEKIWNEIEVGKHYTGTVKSLTSYGAFVDIGGIDGMIHVSELSWSRIKQPSEILSVGDEVEVYVINFDKETRKISLGHKDPNGNPWTRFMDSFSVGDVAPVKIVKLMPFGAFAEVLPGVDGLIHISQIANRRIGKPDEVLAVGDVVDVKIIAVDEDKQKISLSIRALSEPAAPARPRVEEEPEQLPAEPVAEEALVYEIFADGESRGVAPAADPE